MKRGVAELNLGVEAQDDEVLVGRLVALAEDWAEAGSINRVNFEALLDEVQLPARLYAMAIASLEQAGISLAPDNVDNDGDDEERGPAVDGFGEFLKRTRHDILTQAQEYALGARIDAGRRAREVLDRTPTLDQSTRVAFTREVRRGRAAEDELAQHNIRLVIHLATKLRHRCSPGLDFEDLVQEGYLGLAHAITKWEHHRNLKFSTYATWWIRQSMERAIADKGATIRLPVHVVDSLRAVVKQEAQLVNGGLRPDPRVIASRLDMPVSKVRMLMSWRNRVDSLDRLVGAGEWALGDTVADDDSTDVEGRVEEILMQGEVRSAVARLTKREADVLRFRFGLDGRDPRTLEEVGTMFGVTRERIRQIENKALGQLKSPLRQLSRELA